MSKSLLRGFKIQKVVGATSPKVIQDYFHKRGLLKNISDFEELKSEMTIQEYKNILNNEITTIEEGTLKQVLLDLHKIYILSKDKPLALLMLDINSMDDKLYLIEEIQEKEIEKNYDKLFYLLEKEEKFIDKKYSLYLLNSYSPSFWRRRSTDIIRRKKDITEEEINALKKEITISFKDITGGKNCVAKYVIDNGKDYLFITAEDIPTTLSLWIKGNVEGTLVKPSFELAFVYDRYEGELDICMAKGSMKIKKNMELLFSEYVLGEKIEELDIDENAYDLEIIKVMLIEDKKMDFCLVESKNVKDIFIRTLKLKDKIKERENITIDTGQNERFNSSEDDIYSSLIKLIKIDDSSENTIPISTLEIIHANLKVLYFDEVTKKEQKKSFSISKLSGCNLGFEGIDEEIRNCLKASKIQISSSEEHKNAA